MIVVITFGQKATFRCPEKIPSHIRTLGGVKPNPLGIRNFEVMIPGVTLGTTYGDVLHKKSLHISVNKEEAKATPTERKFFFHLPTARFYSKNETPQDEKFSSWGKKKSLRPKPEANNRSMKLKNDRWHFLSKHREMTAHFTTLWDSQTHYLQCML